MKAVLVVIVYSKALPKKKYEVRIATNDEIIIGTRDAMEISIMKTSMAKIIPVIGAWKIDAKPAAQPIPISTTIFFWFRRSNCPILEPMAEPVETDGPSSPTEPPKPTVSELVMIDAKVL